MKKRHSPAEVARSLRKSDVLRRAARSLADVSRKLGVRDATYQRWRWRHDGMEVQERKELTASEPEKDWLEAMVAEEAEGIRRGCRWRRLPEPDPEACGAAACQVPSCERRVDRDQLVARLRAHRAPLDPRVARWQGALQASCPGGELGGRPPSACGGDPRTVRRPPRRTGFPIRCSPTAGLEQLRGGVQLGLERRRELNCLGTGDGLELPIPGRQMGAPDSRGVKVLPVEVGAVVCKFGVVLGFDEVEAGHARLSLVPETLLLDQFAFGGREGVLGQGVVVGAADRAHRKSEAGVLAA